ncbi:SDR family oxidoreductase [Legionella impletisoli]|uniref:Short-chain dehydrogenase n=1 Tax=Legionella impletisoli TaxID=343510 RepID=A0A917NEB0_9GAMM|nr:SDR family oxidoreductase [Legionella impletisoli]GGI89501.1 short-chain dehydrogenase [Legionella impletisoli]
MKQVLITGANRGIGFSFAKALAELGFTVFATCRHPKEAKELQQLSESQENIHIKTLDITNDDNIQQLADELSNTSIDWLINNAGISGEQGVTVGNISRDNFLKVFEVNCLSTLKVSEAFLPHLAQSQDKLIICISSRMGSISDNERGRSYAYRTSKAALNCALRSFAIDVAKDDVNVMLLHPGWVKTDMGGEDAELTPEESVRRMLNVINQHKVNSHAEVLWSHDGSIIEW